MNIFHEIWNKAYLFIPPEPHHIQNHNKLKIYDCFSIKICTVEYGKLLDYVVNINKLNDRQLHYRYARLCFLNNITMLLNVENNLKYLFKIKY